MSSACRRPARRVQDSPEGIFSIKPGLTRIAPSARTGRPRSATAEEKVDEIGKTPGETESHAGEKVRLSDRDGPDVLSRRAAEEDRRSDGAYALGDRLKSQSSFQLPVVAFEVKGYLSWMRDRTQSASSCPGRAEPQ